jgi:hypothetical protein
VISLPSSFAEDVRGWNKADIIKRLASTSGNVRLGIRHNEDLAHRLIRYRLFALVASGERAAQGWMSLLWFDANRLFGLLPGLQAPILIPPGRENNCSRTSRRSPTAYYCGGRAAASTFHWPRTRRGGQRER